MFLIKDQRHGTPYLVFTWEDPRKDGYKGSVEEVSLDYDMEAVHSWPDGHARPEACVGRTVDKPTHYKVFRYHSDLEAAKYQPVPGAPVVFGTWWDYIKLGLLPPDPERTDDEIWYEFLDKVDEDTRRLRRRAQPPDAPTGKNRDDVAAWVAKKHFFADTSIREVWYLPGRAPADEIRLLELSDRLASADPQPEPLDFGLDVQGARFRLFIADVSSEQLDQIKQDSTRLPAGWSLDGKMYWRRGA